MSDRHSSRFERLLETTARKVGGGSLHPVELLQRVQQAVEATRTSEGKVANDIRISLHPDDYDRFRVDLPRLKSQIDRLLDAREKRDGLTRLGERRVAFESSLDVAAGMPGVTARFANVVRLGSEAPARATRRLSRHTGLALVFDDGSRVTLTHTPFTIGRASDNDLVLVDLTVSVHHAEIVRALDGFAIRDLGSRNGIAVDGETLRDGGISPGATITLGNTVLRLEPDGG